MHRVPIPLLASCLLRERSHRAQASAMRRVFSWFVRSLESLIFDQLIVLKAITVLWYFIFLSVVLSFMHHLLRRR